MAALDKGSSYRQVQVVDYYVYNVEETDLTKPIRIDRVHSRRFTSWAELQGSEPYVTLPGDTLPGLADRFFRDSRKWRIIADFNFDVVFDPFELPVNIVLTIPPLSFVGFVPSQI